jgi:anti-sigma B factor antagonist
MRFSASVEQQEFPVQLESIVIDDVTAVAMKGRVDSTNAEGFRDGLDGLIRAGASRLLIDMKDVVYISSAGFRALLLAGRAIDQASGQLVLCGIEGELKRLFDLAAFTELFTILPSRDDALAHLRVPASR